MSNYIIGVICLALSIWTCFFSPREGMNMLGYKSPQGMHKNIWKFSNKCFGIFGIVGSSLYLLINLIFKILGLSDYYNDINKYAIIYIYVSIIITEIYTFVRFHKSR